MSGEEENMSASNRSLESQITLKLNPPVFAYTAVQIKRIYALAIGNFEGRVQKILAIPLQQRTFKNTVVALDSALAELEGETKIPQFLSYVSPSPKIRAASEDLKLKIAEYTIDFHTRADVYSAIKTFFPERKSLRQQEVLLLEKLLKDFERNGLGLKIKQKEAVARLSHRLVKLSLDFQKNLREAVDYVEMRSEELSGLSDDYISGLKRIKKGYLVGMSYPEYFPFMENAVNRAARRKLFRVYNNRCYANNLKLLEESLVLRRSLAKLLGYQSFAEYVLEDRMAKKISNVNAFLSLLQKELWKKTKKEFKALAAANGVKCGDIEGWDLNFYINNFNKSSFSADQEEVRAYFPLQKVLGSTLEIFAKIFGVKIVPAKIPVWHKDVFSFAVLGHGRHAVAYIYFDLFPRQGKFTHGMCSSLRTRRLFKGELLDVPAAAVVANFSTPSPSRPSLLKFSEIETLFHELGHVAYGIFSKPSFHRLSNGNSPLDFVEVPSMLFQAWAYEPEVLRRISAHYIYPERKVPDRLVNSLLGSKNNFSGWTALRLLALSRVDMRYHSRERIADTTSVYRDIVGKISRVPVMKGTHPQAGLIHLMPGYAAGLYSYLWADVIAADIFTEFKKGGLFCAGVGKRYKREILYYGAGLDSQEAVRRFLGRSFGTKAYLKRMLA